MIYIFVKLGVMYICQVMKTLNKNSNKQNMCVCILEPKSKTQTLTFYFLHWFYGLQVLQEGFTIWSLTLDTWAQFEVTWVQNASFGEGTF